MNGFERNIEFRGGIPYTEFNGRSYRYFNDKGYELFVIAPDGFTPIYCNEV